MPDDPHPDDDTAFVSGLEALAAAGDGAGPRSGSRRRRSRLRRTWVQRGVLAASVVLTVGCLVAASALSYSITKIDQIRAIDIGQVGGGDDGLTKAPAGAARNFLLVGVDESAGLDAKDPVLIGRAEERNSDTIMILRVDPAAKQVYLLSLPRDLWVGIGGPDGPKGRINSALSQSPLLLIKTITDTLKIPVDHYVEVNLNGFKQLVQAVGGVPMEFRYPTQDPSTGLYQFEPGCKVLDADQALAFARSRKLQIKKPGTDYWVSDGGDDLARAKRQQEFVRAALKAAIGRGARNPAVLNEMIDIGLRNVRPDQFLTVGELLDLAGSFRDFDPAAIMSYTPSVTEGYAGAAAILTLDERKSQPIFEIFRGHNPLEDVRPFVRVEVRSSTGERNKAAAVGFELATNKFTVTAAKDDNSYRGRPTRILYADDDEKVSAVILARYLDLDVPIERGPIWQGDSRIALVVGTDWKGLRAEPRPLSDFKAQLPPGMVPDVAPSSAASPSSTTPLPFAVTTSSVAGEIPSAPQGCG